MWSSKDFQITHLGERTLSARQFEGLKRFSSDSFWIEDDERIPAEVAFSSSKPLDSELAFEIAGPRQMLYFNPREVRAGLVTCGGICPGLNDVIRALYMELFYVYGVTHIEGYRFGFRGMDPANKLEPLILDHALVADIHGQGGTILGTSRGFVEPRVILANLMQRRINVLFVIGGDGTQRGAHALWSQARAANYPIAIIGIPKTIDNDINFVYKTFGFDTAVSFARQALDSAHIEAKGNPFGIGLVKVMGRDSGFIAAYATLASINVNYTLIPEIPFDLEGPAGFLTHLEARMSQKQHAVIVVAEGAGQDLLVAQPNEFDASGNKKHGDIGIFLKNCINTHFKARDLEVNLKYFDPSYMLRSVVSNAYDSIFAAGLARNAVHAAMAGKTDLMIGRRFNQFIHVPIPIAVASRKKIEPDSRLWMSVLQATGQPATFKNGTPLQAEVLKPKPWSQD